jgi:signal peptidase I
MSEEHKRDVASDALEPRPVETPEAAAAPEAAAGPAVETGAGEIDAAEAAFAASESGVRLEEHTPTEVEAVQDADAEAIEPVATAADDAPPAEVAAEAEPARADSTPVEPAAPEPVLAAAAAAGAVAASRPIWSDQGDAPFDDGGKKEKIPAAARVKDHDDDGGRSAGSETFEIVKTIVVALAIAFVLRVLLFQPFTIPSASMEPNLYEGDYIVVSKWTYGYSKYSSGLPINLPLGEGRVFGRAPERGDIVVFKLPRDNRTDYIKRVIGLPGDRIQMIANVLHINGQPVNDVVVSRGEVEDVFGPRSMIQARETLPNGKSFLIQDFGPGGDLDDTPVYEVPAGHYFMMGDNRDNSIDSRVQESAGVGLVPEENLVGKAEIIAFSWSPGASLFNPVSWFANVRPSRFFRVLD